MNPFDSQEHPRILNLVDDFDEDEDDLDYDDDADDEEDDDADDDYDFDEDDGIDEYEIAQVDMGYMEDIDVESGFSVERNLDNLLTDVDSIAADDDPDSPDIIKDI